MQHWTPQSLLARHLSATVGTISTAAGGEQGVGFPSRGAWSPTVVRFLPGPYFHQVGKILWIRANQTFKQMNGTQGHMIPSHLDEFMWREKYGQNCSLAFHNLLLQI